MPDLIPTNLEQIRAGIARRKMLDLLFVFLGLLALSFAFLFLVALIADMAVTGLPRLSWQFFTSFPSRKPEEAGILSAWVGTLLVMLVTAAVSVPVGIASGIYLEEYARKNWLFDLIEINVNNLAGVPSIVYGLLALGFFVYLLNLGDTVLTAGLTLTLLILPVVIVTTREALRAIPNSIREAAVALGASKWKMVWDHTLPYAMGNILTGIIVGLSRAIGETAPLITIGALTFISFLPEAPIQPNFPYLSFAWLKAPFTVLSIQMFNWTSRPDPAFQENAAGAGLVLVVLTLMMNGLAIYLRYRFRKGIRW